MGKAIMTTITDIKTKTKAAAKLAAANARAERALTTKPPAPAWKPHHGRAAAEAWAARQLPSFGCHPGAALLPMLAELKAHRAGVVGRFLEECPDGYQQAVLAEFDQAIAAVSTLLDLAKQV